VIDFDAHVLAPNFAQFGEPATYLPAAGGEPFAIDVIFDRAYTKDMLMDDGKIGFTTVSPTAGIRYAQFATDPKQNDRVYVPRLDLTFLVRNVMPDSHGGGRLQLNRVSEGVVR
jgi:hypothetical protein